jgi:hypothetical protein
MKAKRLAFWGAVAGVSIAANFFLELAAAKIPNQGLRRLADFIHRGPAQGG